MQYINKIPNVDVDLKNKMIYDGWKRLKEPGNLISATLISLPIAFINMYICYIFMGFIDQNIRTIIGSIFYSGHIVFNIKLIYIIYIYGYILIHEIIHMIVIPNFIKSKSTFISVKLWGGFVYTEEVINKRRYLIITILPFIILSFIVPSLMLSMGVNPIMTLTLAMINAAGSSVDVLLFILLLQVPKHSNIRNNGIETFYLKSKN